jgi:DNA mismatch repair ATPase MutS
MVTQRAEEVLGDLEAQSQNGHHRTRSRAKQISLFGEPSNGLAAQVLDDLLSLDITTLTPLEALTHLHELQQKGRGG